MEFDNSFEVPLPPEEAFRVLLDIPRIAPCMPGAELTGTVDERTYRGRLGVRLGPVALTFAGTVRFEEIDAVNHTARATAQAADAKGRGAASAVATFAVDASDIGTRVKVHTDLALSGAVAQYGRGAGIIRLTAEQIVGQFAGNLKAQLAREKAADAAAAPGPTDAGPAAATPARDGDGDPAGAPAVRPISGFALMARVFLAFVGKLFGRA